MTSLFQPINKAHAITEMAVFIQVEANMGKSLLEKIDSSYNEFKEELPNKKELTTITGDMSVGDDGRPKGGWQETKAGFELRSFKLNGNVSWLVRVSSNTISIHCLEYIRWAPFLKQTSKYLKNAFEILNSQGVDISIVGLKCTDMFTYSGDIESYDSKQLFKENCPYISNKLLSSGELWHNHIGWYVNASDVVKDRDDEKYQILNQLNVDSAYNTISGKRTLASKVEHNQIFQINNDISGIDNSNAFEASFIEQLLNGLHTENKRVLQEILVDEMQKRISLGGESE